MQQAAFTRPRSVRAAARHHSTAREQIFGEGRWTPRTFNAGVQRQPPAAVMIQRHQWRTWHRRQVRESSGSYMTAASPPSAPTGDESRRKEAGVRRRCRRCQSVPSALLSFHCRLTLMVACARPPKRERTSAFLWYTRASTPQLGLGSGVMPLLLSSLLSSILLPRVLTPVPAFAMPPSSYLKKHEQLMSQSDALLSLSNSKRAIWASIAGGTLVFAGKLCVVMYCGGMGEASDSIVAETAHSFVDVLNQAFLLVGIQRSQRPVSDLHPRGTYQPTSLPMTGVGLF